MTGKSGAGYAGGDASQLDERAEFEKWVINSHTNWKLGRDEVDKYQGLEAHYAWLGWQARAELSGSEEGAAPQQPDTPKRYGPGTALSHYQGHCFPNCGYCADLRTLKHIPQQYLKERWTYDYSGKRNLYEISSGGYILAETEDSEIADAICKVFNDLMAQRSGSEEEIAQPHYSTNLAPVYIAEQIFFHVLLKGGTGNPFHAIASKWFVDLAAAKIRDLLTPLPDPPLADSAAPQEKK